MRRIYQEEAKGKSVIDAFRRYMQDGDGAKITEALRDYLMMRESFIAHFDAHTFRSVYDGDRLSVIHQIQRAFRRLDGEHTSEYADGMTDIDIGKAIRQIIDAEYDRVEAEETAAERAAELSLARTLASKHGYRVVAN